MSDLIETGGEKERGSVFTGSSSEVKDKIQFSDFSFKLQEFESVDQLDEYIAHKDFGYSEDHPGVCFGFSVKEYS